MILMLKNNLQIKILYIRIILFAGLFLLSIESRSQDAQFSQFYESPLTLNPSLAGSFAGDVRILANYKNQWSSVSVPYKTFAFSGDMVVMRDKFESGFPGIGISVMSDKAGTSKLGTNQANLSIAYHVHISYLNFISAGINMGYSQRSIDFNNLQWNSQYDGYHYDPSLPSLEKDYSESKSYPDVGAGLQWTYKKGEMYSTANDEQYINAGISFFHLNNPNVSFYNSAQDRLPTRLALHGSYRTGLKNSNMSVASSFLYEKQGPIRNIILGASVNYRLIDESKITGIIKGAAISFGANYRFRDAIIPIILIQFSNYTVSLSYDVNVSRFKKASLGREGLEVSLKFVNLNPFSNEHTHNKNPLHYD